MLHPEGARVPRGKARAVSRADGAKSKWRWTEQQAIKASHCPNTVMSLWQREISRRPPLDAAMTAELFAAREAASAEQRKKLDDLIVEGNLRLIMKIARKYDRGGERLLDLCQEGAAGCMRAIERYDRLRGVSFPAYATWWIRQAISQCARSTNRNVRMPAHAATTLRKLIDAERAGGNTQCVDGSSEVVTSAVKHARNEVSLSATIGSRSRSGEMQQARTLADTLVDPMPTPEAALLCAELREAVRRGIADLSAPELVALRMRFGLVDASEEDEGAAPDA